ncbi:homoserine dehydrogenase [Gorillibacterium sp. CAU 1737]|uniref:homoserine dehydrogenase n=1 Tax=Gorillibacterium sp. CAU 1737 TaxID=3140362 RepID=UPI003261892E
MKPIKVGMLGLGTVGTGVVRIVEGHQEDLVRQIGTAVEISRILVNDVTKNRSISIPQERLTEKVEDILHDPDIDVIVEVMGGLEPTKGYVMEALAQGKHIVTANKDLLALYGTEIMAQAHEYKRDVMYEASVAGGIPIIRTLTEGFSSDRILKIMGIVNGTTNYILSAMSREGAAYADVLKEAQGLGYAEADPTSDVEGLDAARKMTILSRLGFHVNVELSDVSVKGISSVTREDIAYGKTLGYEVKLLGIAERTGDGVSVSVEPTMVRLNHPLASVSGVFNAVYVFGESVGETMFYGPGAGELPTATSIVADLVTVAKNLRLDVNGSQLPLRYQEKKLRSPEQIVSKYFLLLRVADRAGVLARITQIFADYKVSLESVFQHPNASTSHAEIIVITHNATKAGMQQVLEEFGKLDVVHEIRSVYRVEG